MTQISEIWAALAVNHMPDKFKVRVLGEDGAVSFEEVTSENLLGIFDIEFNNRAMSKARLEIERQQLVDALNVILPNNVDQLRGMPVADQRVLMSKFLETYNFGPEVILTDEKYQEAVISSQETNQQIQQDIQANQPEVAGNPLAALL
jgi:hypothetical protein